MHPFHSPMMDGLGATVPIPMMNGLGATVPIPMAAMQGLGTTPPNGTTQIDPVIDGVSGPMHIALGAVAGLAVGWIMWKK